MDRMRKPEFSWLQVIVVVIVLILILVMVQHFTKPVNNTRSIFEVLTGRKPRGKKVKIPKDLDYKDDGVPRPSASFDDLFTAAECAELVTS